MTHIFEHISVLAVRTNNMKDDKPVLINRLNTCEFDKLLFFWTGARQINLCDRKNTLYFFETYVSADVVDVPIAESSQFSPTCYSHKLNGVGLRYERNVSLQGFIVLINGPHKV